MKRIYCNEDVPVQEVEMVTIDGFTLVVREKFTKVNSPIRRHAKTVYDHLFYIEEFEVSDN